ncbi:hypothetical protein BH23VER1_BH23VER1_33420 [soil metagenome]
MGYYIQDFIPWALRGAARFGALGVWMGSVGIPGGMAAAEVERTRFAREIPAPDDSAGGIIAADLNDDGAVDLLVTVPGHIAAYATDGTKLWTREVDVAVGGQSESQGLPGHHGPGVTAGDVDGDGRTEVVFLTRDSTLHIADGATGLDQATARPPIPEGAERWELAAVADFRGTGRDEDVLLQATNKSGYRMGRYLAAYRIADLLAGKAPLWATDSFVSCAHNGARLADLDGDGRDEILGATVLGPDGQLVVEAAPFEGHMDSVFAADVRPDVPGLEVVLLEEGSNHVQLIGGGRVLWREANLGSEGRGREPQNAVIGRFGGDGGQDDGAMFIWCRSRHTRHQEPFVFDADGKLVLTYQMDEVKPEGWTDSGVEVIHTIDWTGAPRQLACAKERHTSGDVGIFEPLGGGFVARFDDEEADRLYVADVTGDWREEVVVLSGITLTIYRNEAANPQPDRPSLWSDRNYRRLKQIHNYYSP